MARIRTLQLNGDLVDNIEVTLKKDGKTWNDVISYLFGYDNFKDYCSKNDVYIDNKRCPYTEDMFEEND